MLGERWMEGMKKTQVRNEEEEIIGLGKARKRMKNQRKEEK